MRRNADIYNGQEKRAPRMKTSWHLDFKITISIIIALALQTLTIVYEVGKLTKQLESNMNDIKILKADQMKGVILSERVVRVETLMENIKYTVDRIERKLDK